MGGPRRQFTSGHCHCPSLSTLPPLRANSSPGDKPGSISEFSHRADEKKGKSLRSLNRKMGREVNVNFSCQDKL